MKTKLNWKMGTILGLVAMVALAAVGVTYASSANHVSPDSLSLCFFDWVEPNDNGSVSNRDGYSPVDPGDNGNDPLEAQAPGTLTTRASGNFASAAAFIATDDTINFNLEKAYPGYHPTIFFGIRNQSNRPLVISTITLHNPYSPGYFAMTLNGVNPSQVIEPGKVVVGYLDVGVGDVPNGGNLNYALSASIVVTQYVSPSKFETETRLTSLPNPSIAGKKILFGAAVTSQGHGVPTGTVTFMEGTNILGTGKLVRGLTAFTTDSLPVGSHSITAVYGGDSKFAGSTSNVVVQKVLYASTTSLSSTPNPSTLGQTVKFTARVSGAGPTPTGTVTFRKGITVIGSAPLINGTAILNYGTLPVGENLITASYEGDINYGASTSKHLNQVVHRGTR